MRYSLLCDPKLYYIRLLTQNFCIWPGADLGGGRGGRPFFPPPPSGIRPPADPKGRPFDIFSEINFWPTDLKIFLKAPWAPIYTNFEGERAPKKTRFFCQNFFKKCPKTAFLTVFPKICMRRRKFCQNRGKSVLWESSKNLFGRPKKKKKVVKIVEIFLKIRPPSRKSQIRPWFWPQFQSLLEQNQNAITIDARKGRLGFEATKTALNGVILGQF